MSCVALGRPFAASACAPTTRKRTRCEHKQLMNSLQSGGNFTVDPWGDLTEELDR
jgi:hypothetical protein